MRVRWTNTALAETEEILSYVAGDSPKAALAVSNEIKITVARISTHPRLAPIVYKNEVRAVIAGRFDYRIFYALREDELIIRNVRSMKRQRPWERE
jgi:plasmid stabilization system protein ParE